MCPDCQRFPLRGFLYGVAIGVAISLFIVTLAGCSPQRDMPTAPVADETIERYRDRLERIELRVANNGDWLVLDLRDTDVPDFWGTGAIIGTSEGWTFRAVRTEYGYLATASELVGGDRWTYRLIPFGEE